jgi:hypothetical protein
MREVYAQIPQRRPNRKLQHAECRASSMEQERDLALEDVAMLREELAALRLSRDQMAHQLGVTIQERDAERLLCDRLAEALRDLTGLYASTPGFDHTFTDKARAALSRYDAARAK